MPQLYVNMIFVSVEYSVRTAQRCLKNHHLQERGIEQNHEEIIRTVIKELKGNSRRLGTGQIWRRLRNEHGLCVKRQVHMSPQGLNIKVTVRQPYTR